MSPQSQRSRVEAEEEDMSPNRAEAMKERTGVKRRAEEDPSKQAKRTRVGEEEEETRLTTAVAEAGRQSVKHKFQELLEREKEKRLMRKKTEQE